MKKGLDPLLSENPRILILGSLPGDKSIELQQYYGHPRNRFWIVMAKIFNSPNPDTYEQKKKLLSENGVVLWDVFASAERKSSLDSEIKAPVKNDIVSFLRHYPTIKIVVTNGVAAAQALDPSIDAINLPSTSPANASWSTEKLIEKWQSILEINSTCK